MSARNERPFGPNERRIIDACDTLRRAPLVYPWKETPSISLPVTFSDALVESIWHDFMARWYRRSET
jgi:hypothetical protein